jgi:hypothetical protein
MTASRGLRRTDEAERLGSPVPLRLGGWRFACTTRRELITERPILGGDVKINVASSGSQAELIPPLAIALFLAHKWNRGHIFQTLIDRYRPAICQVK